MALFWGALLLSPRQSYAACQWHISPTADANSEDNGLLAVAAASTTDAWAAGEYYDFLNRRKVQTLIEHWDGTRWTIVPSPNATQGMRPLDNYLFAAAADSASDAWVVGSTNTTSIDEQTLSEHWDGKAWTIVPSPKTNNPSRLWGTAVLSPSDAWAVGYSSTKTFTEHWNGAVWSIVPSPTPSADGWLKSVTAIATNDVWAVGGYLIAPGWYQNLIEHWDGRSWMVAPDPTPDRTLLFGVAAGAAADVWAVGAAPPYTAPSHPVALHWNGSRWAPIIAPNAGQFYNDFESVAWRSDHDVWAVGVQGTAGGSATLTEQWNGSRWTVVSSPNRTTSDELDALAAPADTYLLAVGDYTSSGGHFRTLALIYHC